MKTQIEVQRHLQSRIAHRRRYIRDLENRRTVAKQMLHTAKAMKMPGVVDGMLRALKDVNDSLREAVADQQVDNRLYRFLIYMNNLEFRVL